MVAPKPAGTNGMSARWWAASAIGVCVALIGLLAAAADRESTAQASINERIEARVNGCEWSAAASEAHMEHVLVSLREIREALLAIQRDLNDMRVTKR